MRTTVIVGVAVLWMMGSAVFAVEPAELQPLSFLVGEWITPDPGQAGAGSGTAVFRRGLQDRVIVRTSYAEYPAAGGKPGSRHDDLMIIYAEDGGVRADYYDNEGHVIRYAVQSPAAGEAVFLSEAGDGEPRFRLSYKLESTGILKGEFSIAPPGTPEDFKPYLTWEAHKTSGDGKD